MGHPRRTGRRALGLLLAVAVVTVVVVVLGVLAVRGGDGEPDADAGAGASPAPAEPTPLADLDTTTLAVARASFCDAVTDETVAAALDGSPTRSAAYDDGEQVRLVRGTEDVAHEYGCLWRSGDVIARAWVFAPPVTPERARELARETRRTEGCERLRDAADYGVRSVALVCDTPRGPVVSHRGLFGDAWLTCTLTAPESTDRDELLERADLYCSGVAQAASA